MLGGGSLAGGDMPQDLQRKATAVCTYFEQGVNSEVQNRQFIPAIFSALFPCNILCIADKQTLHVVFNNVNTGGLPTESWLDRRNQGPFSSSEVVNAAVQQSGFVNPYHFQVALDVLDLPEEQQRQLLNDLALHYVGGMVKLATRPQAISGYQGLQPHLDAFSIDHPEFDKNVFIAMRFRTGKQFLEIHEAVKSGLAKYGLKALRSDDKVYPPDGDLWSNICVYMMGCKFGVCVFEEIDEREFNPNVPLEYGFMRAMNRRVLLLKDIRMPKMPSDITGKLYRDFDTYNITHTVDERISQWAERDLGLKAIR
jgi:hypothetical protein